MTMVAPPIDVWDVATFDAELRAALDAKTDLVRDYFVTDRRQWIEHDESDHVTPIADNPHQRAFNWLSEDITRLMEARVIRAWHYSRMTDADPGNHPDAVSRAGGCRHVLGGYRRAAAGRQPVPERPARFAHGDVLDDLAPLSN